MCVSVCIIQLVSANIIFNLSIFILKFSDHLFSNLIIDMCQEKKEKNGYILKKENVKWNFFFRLPIAHMAMSIENIDPPVL